MARAFDLGYSSEPFRTLLAEAPRSSVYQGKDFRVEWVRSSIAAGSTAGQRSPTEQASGSPFTAPPASTTTMASYSKISACAPTTSTTSVSATSRAKAKTCSRPPRRS
jgi:hypothetical protein